MRSSCTRTLIAAGAAAGALALGAAVPAHAQAGAAPRGAGDSTWSLLPYTQRGYMGLNVGRSDYSPGCGIASLSCDRKGTAAKLYTGGMFSQHFGAELGYINLGRAERGGGRTSAQGLNVSLLARVPIDRFNVFAKAGATYGRTRVSAQTGSGIVAGRGSGWGASYGVGAGYDLTDTSGVVLEWERHRMRFAGGSRDNVDALTLGYVHRF